jgi:hypothetical protein
MRDERASGRQEPHFSFHEAPATSPARSAGATLLLRADGDRKQQRLPRGRLGDETGVCSSGGPILPGGQFGRGGGIAGFDFLGDHAGVISRGVGLLDQVAECRSGSA